MFKSIHLNFLPLPQVIYALVVAFFLLGFFILPNDDVLHKVFIYGILLLFPLIAQDVWRSHLLKHPLLYFILAYMLYAALSGLWTVPTQVAMTWYKPFVRTLYIMVFCLGVAWVSLRTPGFFEKLLTALVFAATFVALIGIISWVVHYGGDFAIRLMGITRAEHSIQGAASFAVIFLLALVRFSRVELLWHKLAYGLAALICLLFVVLAQTRGVLISIGVSVLVYVILRRDFKLLLIFAFSALVILALSFYSFDLPKLWAGLTNMLSMSFRMEMWHTIFEQALQRPWFGHGFLHDSRVMAAGILFPHAHNIYLSIFFFSGLVGLLLYCMMILSALYYAYQNRQIDKYMFAGLAVIFASVALISDVGRVIVSPNDLWFYLWFPIGILLSTRIMK
ncbi:MAG: O-antigen ligase family protein [Gammaproteobacteria bacterium]